MRCCSTWKLPIGNAELLALFGVFDGVHQHFSHAPHRFRTDRGGTLVAGLLQRRRRRSGFPEQRARGQAQAIQHQIRGAPVVDGPVTGERKIGTRSLDVDEEERESF